jgi:hypothetical protein
MVDLPGRPSAENSEGTLVKVRPILRWRKCTFAEAIGYERHQVPRLASATYQLQVHVRSNVGYQRNTAVYLLYHVRLESIMSRTRLISDVEEL